MTCVVIDFKNNFWDGQEFSCRGVRLNICVYALAALKRSAKRTANGDSPLPILLVAFSTLSPICSRPDTGVWSPAGRRCDSPGCAESANP